jgi:hypothetical protein
MAGPGEDVLLRDWRQNLAIMAANRTSADVEPIMQLGDRLLTEQGQVRGAIGEGGGQGGRGEGGPYLW